MRSCIYCGKELEKDEKCNCYSAINRRNQNKKASTSDTDAKNDRHEDGHNSASNSYHTGYTRRENPFKSAWNRYTTRKNAARQHYNNVKKTPRRNIFFDTLSFFKSPATTALYTSHLGISFVFIIAALAGALAGLCIYLILLSFIKRVGSITSPLTIPLALWSGTEILSGIAFSLIVGAIVGVVIFLLYCTSFYIVNRLIFRDSSKFSEFLRALSLCPLPLAVSGVFGVISGLFSIYLMAVILLCGAVFTIILTYEVLKARWRYQSENQILYGTLLGFLMLAMLAISLIPKF